MARDNHLGNMIYEHDLDKYTVGSHNCLSIPFDDLLANGFNTRQTDVRPAGSVNTAFQLVAVIFQLQSLQQFGGVSATHIDWTMVPYVRKSFFKHYIIEHLKDVDEFYNLNLIDMKEEELDDWVKEHKNEYLTKWNLKEEDFTFSNKEKLDSKLYQRAIYETRKEVHQAVEGMYHNLNTLQSRSGNQLPFTSINYGTCTEPEGRMITKALLQVSIEGLGSLRKTSIFPCGIFQIMKGVNKEPGTPNYDLKLFALESTAQRLYPNYANVDWSGNAGYDINDPRTYFSTMGCRTANGWDINGFGQLKDGRGNICPVTVIMPTLAMMAKELTEHHMNDFSHPSDWGEENYNIVETFLYILDQKIHEAKDMLIERFDWICSQSPESAKFMYENGLMAGYVPEEGIRSALKHGTLAIGQLGLAETLQILIGEDHTTEKGMEVAKQIEGLFKKRCAEFKEEYKLNFGVYYTPAENLCYTAMQKFKAQYGEIPNVSDKDFFTNSMHVPVWKEMSPFEKIDIESQLTGYSSAGCITYVELDATVKNNIKALEQIVDYAMDKDIPYFAVNVPNDTCLKCGFCDEFNDECPVCGSHDIQQLRRVTGYLTTDYRRFNAGKKAETEQRIKHSQF
jgi:ribonucleoside-triphosphate reductase